MSPNFPSPPSLPGAGGSGPAPPAGARPPSPARRALVTLLAALPWVLVLFQLLVVVPRYEQLFREYGLKVPALTQLLLDLSAWANAHVLLAGLLTLGLMAAGVLVAHVAQSGGTARNARLLLLVIVFAVPCGLFVLSWVGVLNTHRTLVEGLKK